MCYIFSYRPISLYFKYGICNLIVIVSLNILKWSNILNIHISTGDIINKIYFPVLVPIGIIGNLLSFLVSSWQLYIPIRRHFARWESVLQSEHIWTCPTGRGGALHRETFLPQTDRQDWKHYLPTTLLVGGKNKTCSIRMPQIIIM